MTLPELPPTRWQKVRHDRDVILARQMTRELAVELGFSKTDQALVATAISELARNIVNYADHGEIQAQPQRKGGVMGLRLIVSDVGPGIEDIQLAMTDGHSTGNSLGLGLPGTKRIVDEFEIESLPGQGVIITITKWNAR
jgi:serine/threonine-protein kinase RsbT